jgi:hypothetical protein
MLCGNSNGKFGNGDGGFHNGTMIVFIPNNMFLMFSFFSVIVLLFVVALCFSITPCGLALLLLLVKLSHSLWWPFVAFCGHVIYSLWLSSIAPPCDHTIVFLVVMFYCSL